MTKEQLKALGLDDNQISEVFKLNGLAITKEQLKVETLTQEIADKTQLLTDANAKIESFKDLDVETIKAEAKKYKEELEAVTLENEAKIKAIQYEATLKDYIQGHAFASERIKQSILNDIKSKEFKLEDGKLLGADDYIAQLKEKEPESFATVEEPNTPSFLRPGGQAISKDKSPVMSITELAQEASIRNK